VDALGVRTESYYIAVSEYGYGIHTIAAAAIRLAQDEVPAKAKPAQLLIYRSEVEVEPVGFTKEDGAIWPETVRPTRKGRGKTKPTLNHAQPKLCGLTTTHTLFVQKPRI